MPTINPPLSLEQIKKQLHQLIEDCLYDLISLDEFNTQLQQLNIKSYQVDLLRGTISSITLNQV